jgi:CBS domain-containing protein
MSLENLLPTKLSAIPLVTCSPNQSIHETSRLMKHKNVGCVLVVEGNNIRGIVTDRDILVRAIAKEPALSVADPISLVMSTPVTTISADRGVQDAMKLMKDAKIRRLPITNSSGKLIGILTFSDLYSLLAHEMQDLKEVIAQEEGFEFGQKVA